MNKHLFKKYLEGRLTKEEFNNFLEEINTLDPETYENLLHEVWLEFENEKYFNAVESAKLLTDLKYKIRQKDASPQKDFTKSSGVIASAKFYRVAASLLAIIVTTLTLFLLLKSDELHTVSTQYAETKSIKLPDNSQIKLNANSTIKYSSDWENNDIREVWLEGEAFFSVNQQTGGHKFVVHTDHMNVEVIGTQFNVNNKGEKTQVVLNEGKIKLNAIMEGHESIFMEPGEFVEYIESDNTIDRRQVDPENYTSWRNNVFIFEDTPIRKIGQRIAEHYGKQVKLADPSIGDIVFTGNVPMGDLDLLLKLVAKSCNVDITHQEDVIRVRDKNNQ